MRNAPNLISLFRLLLAPVAAWAILEGEYRFALAVFAAAAVTDGLDGLLARRLNAASRLGAYLDPIADKALLSTVYLVLGIAGLAPWWLVGLVFGRDLLIVAMVATALLFTRYRDFPPSAWGKISTGFQMLAAVVVIVGKAFPAWGIRPEPLLYLAAAATVASGAGYLWRGCKMAGAALRRGLTAE
jgi:cardiolipin synthase